MTAGKSFNHSNPSPQKFIEELNKIIYKALSIKCGAQKVLNKHK